MGAYILKKEEDQYQEKVNGNYRLKKFQFAYEAYFYSITSGLAAAGWEVGYIPYAFV